MSPCRNPISLAALAGALAFGLAVQAAEAPLPDPAAALRMLQEAGALAAKGDAEAALELGRKAVALDPRSHVAHFELGKLCLQLGRKDCVQREFAAVLRLRPHDVELLASMADAFEKAGELDLAANTWREVQRLAPQRAEEVRRRLASLRRRGRGEVDPVEVPILDAGSVLLVDGALRSESEEVEVRFLLDTGATLTVISHQLARRLAVGRAEQLGVARFQTAAGTIVAPILRLEAVRVGDAVAEGVAVAVHDVPGGETIDAVLGLSFLNEFRYTIDAGGGSMVLEPR